MVAASSIYEFNSMNGEPTGTLSTLVHCTVATVSMTIYDVPFDNLCAFGSIHIWYSIMHSPVSKNHSVRRYQYVQNTVLFHFTESMSSTFDSIRFDYLMTHYSFVIAIA